MEDFTDQMTDMLHEKLACYRQLSTVVNEERDHIVSMAVDALWKTAEQKKQLAARIEQIREKILTLLETTFPDAVDMNTRTFSLGLLIRSLPLAEVTKKGLKTLKQDIECEKRRVAELASQNRGYVSKYLTAIDDIMSIVTDNRKERRYTDYGHLANNRKSNCLFSAEV